MVGGCTVKKGPGVDQTPSTTTSNGAVDGVSVHTEIYKDGFWMVGCMGDEMVTKGDKSGDGACDLPCEGDSASICGGETMSTLYQMHECVGQFAQKVQDTIDDSDELYGYMEDAEDALMSASSAMQASGDTLESFTEGSASPL